MTDRILWQSEHFPRLVLTEEHLELLKRNYPTIHHFEPLMREMELWLHDKPRRAPRSNWRRFISNWCRKAAQIQERRRFAQQGDAARREENDPKALGEIMNNIIAKTRA